MGGIGSLPLLLQDIARRGRSQLWRREGGDGEGVRGRRRGAGDGEAVIETGTTKVGWGRRCWAGRPVAGETSSVQLVPGAGPGQGSEEQRLHLHLPGHPHPCLQCATSGETSALQRS